MSVEKIDNSDGGTFTAWDEMAETVNKRTETVKKAKNNKAFKALALGLLVGAGMMLMTGCGNNDANATSTSEYTSVTPTATVQTVEKSSFDSNLDIDYDTENIEDAEDIEDNEDAGSEVDSGNFESSHDRAKYWEGNTFHLDEYARDAGFKDLNGDSMIHYDKTLKCDVTLYSYGSRIDIVDYDFKTLASINFSGTGNKDLEDKEFLGQVHSGDSGSCEVICNAIDMCSTTEGVRNIINGGELPDGWVYVNQN